MKRDSKLDKAHEAIFAEFRRFGIDRAHNPNAFSEHVTRIRQLTNAKMRIAFSEGGK